MALNIPNYHGILRRGAILLCPLPVLTVIKLDSSMSPAFKRKYPNFLSVMAFDQQTLDQPNKIMLLI